MGEPAAWKILLFVAFAALLLSTAFGFVLFLILTDRVRILRERGDTEGAYRLSQGIVRVLSLPLLRKSTGRWFLPIELLQTGKLAEACGDTEAALGWLRTAAGGNFPRGYRIMALHNQATLLRKLHRLQEAQQIEQQALDLSKVTETAGEKAAMETVLTHTTRNAMLLSQGRFQEALQHLEEGWLKADELGRMGIAAQKAIVLSELGRYDEALAAQSDMEVRYRNITKQSTNGRAATSGLRAIHDSSAMKSRLARIRLCLQAGKVGAASEIWDDMPADYLDDTIESLRYATGAWLFAARGDEEVARRLIAEAPASVPPEQQTPIHDLIARALLTLRDYDAAVLLFQRLIEESAGQPVAVAEYGTLLAACYAKQEKYDRAMAEYEKVVAAGFEEAAFTREARTELARLRANWIALTPGYPLGARG